MDLDILELNIPLLMSKRMMKQMKMVIDLEDYMVTVEGEKINLETTERVYINYHWKRM